MPSAILKLQFHTGKEDAPEGAFFYAWGCEEASYVGCFFMPPDCPE